ncbi:hypothetical protein ACWDHH_07755 [Janibacter hoylei]|uniref:hypothetical protein n=1 Tax=Janibacter TaxID=53457 RepID=UPI0012E9BB37|nr:hypothetical protein [Janibacter hoylei]MCT1618217.1 hypothetical protein [Janibacter hoylei]MCW4601493.1 hypothetical protein [Janibacter hoylei]
MSKRRRPSRLRSSLPTRPGIAERLGHWWFAEPSLTRAELVGHYADFLPGGLGGYARD